MTEPFRVYIGYDQREPVASEVAEFSIRRHASVPVSITHLKADTLAAHGLLRRPSDRRGNTYDIYSNAYQSTDFSIARFIVPLLAHSGWALFVDADVVVTTDIAELFALADNRYAIMVVPHDQQDTGLKMDGQVQYAYARKNQSSVFLINVDDQANRRLSLQDINERPGRHLHNFYWLSECEIGYLPGRWNWLVGVEEKPKDPAICHFTKGGPWFKDWPGAPHDEIWLQELVLLGEQR